ncbi:MAG: hypothetical protein L6R37_001594 [Teloschistes peruensis]|nr:MAG: hypothetical protein L6R37_001594 [Teloschistes peruensis]
MAPSISPRDGQMAVPNTPESNSIVTNHITRCSHSCSIALGTVLPIIAVAIILTIAYFAWYVPRRAQRQRQRADEERIRNKLAGEREEEESVATSDVSSLDGQVHELSEEAPREERMVATQAQRQMQTRKVEEGHEHDHVLAMITARP